MTTISHLAPADRWRARPAGTPYLPAEFDADGSVHATASEELMLEVANALFRQASGDFVLLVINLRRLTAPVRWERPSSKHPHAFPHFYRAIDP